MNQLEPCPSCRRHLRTIESTCPFCGATVATAMQAARPRTLPRTRLGRAALFAFGIGVAATGSAACVDSRDPGQRDDDDGADDDDADDARPDDGGRLADADREVDEGRTMPVYGAPVQPDGAAAADRGREGGLADAGKPDASDAALNDAASGDGGNADSAVDGGLRRLDSGGVIALYGAPPVQRDEEGGGAPVTIYGAPSPSRRRS